MAVSRKDPKGRKLNDGESWRSDGRYCYRYTDPATGKRNALYASDLPQLRIKEKKLEKDLEDGLLTGTASQKMTLNALFEYYLETRVLSDTTRVNYTHLWNRRVRDEIGMMKVVLIRPSHIKRYYAKLSQEGYAHATIKNLHGLIHPSLKLAVEDDLIRKNPADCALGDYGRKTEERKPLTVSQQESLLEFVKNSNIYNVYHPMLVIMLETAVRCGELIGLTKHDIDFKEKTVSIDHQLIYRNWGDGCNFHITLPKTDAGIRMIPMTNAVAKAFKQQRKINLMTAKDKSITIDGYSGFLFTAKSGKPLMPGAVNNILYNIVDAYNKAELEKAKKERRKAKLMPKFSAHVLRHTACTRMAEKRIDIKVLQYIMGHASADVTMNVYNHVADRDRIISEIARLDSITG